MIESLFHAWERRLASVTTDRVVRPFDWGLDWIDPQQSAADDRSAHERLEAWVSRVMHDTDAFFAAPPTRHYSLSAADPHGERVLTFPTALATPHAANNTVHARLIPARNAPTGRPRAAVLVLPQWNADESGHLGLCRLLAVNGLAALRLSLPYHDRRMPAELHRADYIVSANVGRTL